jgi:hypothetical protein
MLDTANVLLNLRATTSIHPNLPTPVARLRLGVPPCVDEQLPVRLHRQRVQDLMMQLDLAAHQLT